MTRDGVNILKSFRISDVHIPKVAKSNEFQNCSSDELNKYIYIYVDITVNNSNTRKINIFTVRRSV